MKRSTVMPIIAFAALAMLFASPALAQRKETLRRIPGVELPKFRVQDGVIAPHEYGSPWDYRETKGGMLIFLAKGEQAGEYGGWYLNYDHQGKDPRVLLVPEPTAGCIWSWTEGGRVRKREFGYYHQVTVKPIAGPYAGWMLTGDKTGLLLREGEATVHFRVNIDDLEDGK
jgi:hypothetical protein